MSITLRWSIPNLPGLLAGNLTGLPSWLPKSVSRASHTLGEKGVDVMRDDTDVNRYTGALGESISAEYDNGDYTVTVSPKALRGGKWDAGLLLEFGTRPIPNAPWGPIAAWAGYRGAPMPGAWLKIRRVGVSPHPFLDRSFKDLLAEVDPVMTDLLDDIIKKIFAGVP